MNDALEQISREVTGKGGRLRVGFPLWMRAVLQRDVIAITFGRTIYLATDAVTRSGGDFLPRLVRHELAHLRQIQRLGLLRFLLRYATEYLRWRSQGMDHRAAYAEISYEREARREERRVT